MPRLEQAPSPFGEITTWDPTQVSGAEQLLDRMSHSEPVIENNEIEVDSQESLSPTADRLEAAANRIAGFLRGRADQKLKISNQEDAFESYEENIQTTKDRERQESYDAAKAIVKSTAKAGLARLKSAGMITLGLGVMGAEATVTGAKNTKKAVETNAKFAYGIAKNEAQAATQRAGEGIIDGWNKAEEVAGKVGQKLENGIDTTITKTKEGIDTVVTGTKNGIDAVKYTAYATKESIKYTKERFLARREAATTRKYERHARWSRIKNEAKAMAETYQKSKRAKTLGRAALANNLFDS